MHGALATASPMAQDFCQGNLFLYIQHRAEEERDDLQDCPVNANNISTAVVEQQNWSSGEGEAEATLSFNKFMPDQ